MANLDKNLTGSGTALKAKSGVKRGKAAGSSSSKGTGSVPSTARGFARNASTKPDSSVPGNKVSKTAL